MNATFFELGVTLLMVSVSVSLVVWFFASLAAASQRRMTRMFTRAGVASDVARRDELKMHIDVARSRCRRCPSEGLCERWLDGKVEGDNGFCLNAQMLRSLAEAFEHGGR